MASTCFVDSTTVRIVKSERSCYSKGDVAKARDIFVREVVEPAFKSERGLVRLLAMLDAWLDYEGHNHQKKDKNERNQDE